METIVYICLKKYARIFDSGPSFHLSLFAHYLYCTVRKVGLTSLFTIIVAYWPARMRRSKCDCKNYNKNEQRHGTTIYLSDCFSDNVFV